MTTETRTMPTPEEAARALDSIDLAMNARDEAIARGIEEGAKGRPVTNEEAEGIQLLVYYQSDAPLGLKTPDDAVATRLASSIAEDPLLTKLLGAWHLEGMVFDWANNPNGVLGRAIDGVVEVLASNRPSSDEA